MKSQAETWYKALAEKPKFIGRKAFFTKAENQDAFASPPKTATQTTYRGPIAIVDAGNVVLQLRNAPVGITFDTPGLIFDDYDIGAYKVDSALTGKNGVTRDRLRDAGTDPLVISFSKKGTFERALLPQRGAPAALVVHPEEPTSEESASGRADDQHGSGNGSSVIPDEPDWISAPLQPNEVDMAYISLEAGQYINDDVITDLFRTWNAYNQTRLELLEDAVYYVTPREMQMLTPNVTLDPETVSDVLRRRPEPILVLPIYHPGNHWSIARYNRPNGAMEHFDSLHSNRYGIGDDLAALHDTYARWVLSNIYARDPYQHQHRPREGIFISKNVPEQTNDYDCGLQALDHALKIQNAHNGQKFEGPLSRERLRTYFVSRYPAPIPASA